jgi:hypothetical protein
MEVVMDSDTDLLDMMAIHELAVSGLYQAFAAVLPEWKTFWTTIANEELGHAAWLRELKSKLTEEGGGLNREHFNVDGLRTSMEFLQRTRGDVLNKGITPLRALSMAQDLEGSLIEKEYFSVYKTDSVAVQEIFTKLREQSVGHRQRIHDTLTAERAKANQA